MTGLCLQADHQQGGGGVWERKPFLEGEVMEPRDDGVFFNLFRPVSFAIDAIVLFLRSHRFYLY